MHPGHLLALLLRIQRSKGYIDHFLHMFRFFYFFIFFENIYKLTKRIIYYMALVFI